MSEPIRPKCDLCHEPLNKPPAGFTKEDKPALIDGWTQWRFSFAEADRVAHTICFEEFIENARQKPTNVVTSNHEEQG